MDEVLHILIGISNYQVGESVHQHMPTSRVGWIDDVTKSASGPVFSCSWYKKPAPVFAFSPSSIKWMVTSPGGLVV